MTQPHFMIGKVIITNEELLEFQKAVEKAKKWDDMLQNGCAYEHLDGDFEIFRKENRIVNLKTFHELKQLKERIEVDAQSVDREIRSYAQSILQDLNNKESQN